MVIIQYQLGEEECLSGDITQDGLVNVLDIVTLVNSILNGNELSGCGLIAADINSDGMLNVLDVVTLVSLILN